MKFRKFKTRIIIVIVGIVFLFFLRKFVLRWFDGRPSVRYLDNNLDCDVFNRKLNDELMIQMAAKMTPSQNRTDRHLFNEIKTDCTAFLENQKYFINLPRRSYEERFRIAFTIVAFKSASQVERLLRTIYRPWNYYCIHVDLKANRDFERAINELVQCLDGKYGNIINTDNRVNVQWGTMSVLQADLNCFRELYDTYKDWKYLINLTGQEFPLKTNAELVRILKSYRGANDIDGTYKHGREDRVSYRLPFPLVWFKGSTHITANREFIRFILESPKIKPILQGLKYRNIPDEKFFSTLNFNSQLSIPGSFVGNPDEHVPANDSRANFMTRYQNWGEYPCRSEKYVRDICIWGILDMPRLKTLPHLFANKFYEDFQPVTLKCMELWYYEKVQKELNTGQIAIKSPFYASLPFVKHRLRSPSIDNY